MKLLCSPFTEAPLVHQIVSRIKWSWRLSRNATLVTLCLLFHAVLAEAQVYTTSLAAPSGGNADAGTSTTFSVTVTSLIGNCGAPNKIDKVTIVVPTGLGTPGSFTSSFSNSTGYSVSAAGSGPTTITWILGTAQICNLSSGTFGFTSTPPTTSSGSYSLTVKAFNGNTALNPTSGISLPINVRAATSTSLSTVSSVYGNASPVTLTADVTSAGGSPTGMVTFRIGSTIIDSSSLSSGSASISYNPSSLSVGVYSISAQYHGNGTFGQSNDTSTLTITARPVTVTADARTKVYGNADPSLTYQITSGSLVGTDAFTGSLSRVAGESVGTRAILQGTLALSNNYAITYVGNNLSITTRPVTVTADARTKVYGNADPLLTYLVTSGSLVGSDVFTGSLSRVAGESAGTFAILQGTLALTSNYTITYIGNNLTITARAITVTANAQTKVYGDIEPVLTYQITSGSLVGGDAISGSLTRVAGEAVGSYTILQGSLALNSNYVVTYLGSSLTITARAIAVTANPQSKVYGDIEPVFTYRITGGYLAGGDAFTGSLTRVSGESVGAHAILQGTLALNGNYVLTFIEDSLSITARAITVTADAKTKTYGNTDPTLTYQITTGNLVGSDVFAGSLTRVAGETVGTHGIHQGSLALGDNYALAFVGENLTITTRAITVTADVKTKSYGASDPTLTYQVTNGSLFGGDAFTGSLTRVAGEAIGTHAILQGTLALDSNYVVTYIGDSLTITTRSITVMADAKTKGYGIVDPALTYQITSGSLFGSDGFTGALSRMSGESVGAHAILQGTLALDSNYVVTYIGDSLTITARAITITADAATKGYGEVDPTLTYQVTSGSLFGTDAFTGSLTRTPGESIGAHAILQGTLVVDSNYAVTYIGDSLTITTRAITVTADAATKSYGDVDPTLTYQVTSGSLFGTDAFTGSLTRVVGESIGVHAILQGTLVLDSNYVMTYIGDGLTITTRAITVTADTLVKTYRDADPPLTYQITTGSLVGSDVFNGNLVRDFGEDLGSYPIEQGTLTLDSNYSLTFLGAHLTIEPITSVTTLSGWHLISLPLLQTSMSPDSIFADDLVVTPSVFGFNQATGYNLVTELEQGYGYWVEFPVGSTIDMLGTYADTVTKPLTLGWNIIGSPFPTPLAITGVSFTDGHTVLSFDDAVAAGWIGESMFDFTPSGYVALTTELQVWAAYWLEVRQLGISITYTQ